MIQLILKNCEQTYNLPQVIGLLEENFDLVFVQALFNECAMGLVYRLGVPLVLFTPLSIPPFIAKQVGNHLSYATTPNLLMGYSQEMTFAQRFFNFGIEMISESLLNWYYVPKAERIYREKLGYDIPTSREIIGNASLVLSNGHFSLSGSKAYFPDVVDVGGIHLKPASPLPKFLEEFVKKGNDGFILFSLGTAIRGDMMPDVKRKMILNVFSKLKQQVLWKWESESMPGLPKNVKLSKWLPQQDLLGHKDIRMFITHCGGGSTEEAIYHGVPLIGIPMMADQNHNAALAKAKGILKELDWDKLTEENFEAAIQEILTNKKYQNNAKRFSSLFKDRPVEPLELGIYWIEYVLRHNGAPHLRSPARKLSIHQYHSLSVDVVSGYLAIAVSVFYFMFAILRFSCCKLNAYLPKKQDKKAKDK